MKLTRRSLRKIIVEELQQLDFYKKYSYGLDDIPDKTKAHDDIIGHTWLTHVKRKDSALDEVGKVLWHSLNESGHIAVYDVQWPNGTVETDIPARLLEGVAQTEHVDEEDKTALHEAHGIRGHEEGAPVHKRRYKK